MHYLEDYLEIIEFLPTELKSRLVQMRHLDDQVHNHQDILHDKTKTLFTLCRKNKQEHREQQYQNLCQEYDKMLKQSDEKVKLANQTYDLLDRHMRRLEQDLSRFMIELEADTAGITEILEQRSYLLDRPPTPEKPLTGQKRTRNSAFHNDEFSINGEYEYTPSPSARSSPAPIMRSNKYPKREKISTFTLSEAETDILEFEEPLSSPSSFYTGTGGKPPLAFGLSDTRPRKRASISQSSNMFKEVLPEPANWIDYVDPNEPRYCLCNQVSYGEMVGCDNTDCQIEWFHYGCVGITEPPKGKWYCPQCTHSIKRKGNKKTS